MLSFACDYLEGAAPEILEALARTNLEQAPGYGNDPFCEQAKEELRTLVGDETADIFFLVGGTQTNQTIIDGMISGYEGVVACDTGHVSLHEAGAIERTGHKVLTVPSHEGKMDAGELKDYLADFYGDANHDHMVFPGMVYISQPTEYGTLYSLAELEALHAACTEYELPLFVDGARLAYALATPKNDVSLHDLARLSDVFYFGGTKAGLLCGEAVVFPRAGAPAHFFTHIKGRGALLAKGRLLGVQFATLFAEGLYERLGGNAIARANELRGALQDRGYEFLLPTPTNQIFVVVDQAKYDYLSERVGFDTWEKIDAEHTAIRFATSWATTEEQVAKLIELLDEAK